MAGEGSDDDIKTQLRRAVLTTFDMPPELLDAMIQAASAGDVGAIKALDRAADPNAPKTAADLPAGVDEALAQSVVEIVVRYCNEYGDRSFMRKLLAMPANDATPKVKMGSTNRNSGFCGEKGFKYTLDVLELADVEDRDKPALRVGLPRQRLQARNTGLAGLVEPMRKAAAPPSRGSPAAS